MTAAAGPALAWALSLALGLAVPALATPTPTPSPTPLAYVHREQVAVTGAAPPVPDLQLRDRPAFVTSIDLAARPPGPASLPDLLAGAVGLNVRRLGGLAAPAQASIRGSSASQVQVLLDGVPLAPAGGGAVDLSTVAPALLERIEVLRGSESALYGSGAMGGVVNLVTRRPGPRPALGLALGCGSFASWEAAGDLSSRLGPADLRCQLAHTRSQGDFTFENDAGTEHDPGDDYRDTRAGNEARSTGGLIAARAALAPGWSGDATFEAADIDRGVPGLTTFPSPHARERSRRLLGSLAVAGRDLAGGRPLSTGLRLFHRATRLEFEDPLGEQTGVPAASDQAGAMTGAAASAAWRPGRLGLEAFADLAEERLDDREASAAYERTTVAAGARADAELWAGRLFASAHLRRDEIEGAGRRWSPKLGLRGLLGGGFELRANAGAGFRAPTFDELYLTEGFVTANPELRPERSRSFDAGLVLTRPRLRAQAALFRTDSDDLIQYVLVSGFRFTPVNIGRARAEGVELDFAWEAFPWLSLAGAYTYLRTEDRSGEPNVDGQPIPGRPAHDAFGRIEGRRGPFSISAELHYLAGNTLTRSGTKELPARRVWNAGAAWEIAPGVQLGAEARNLGDSRVVDVRGYPLPGRSFAAALRWRTEL